MTSPLVSVIITTRDSAGTLGELLQSIKRQTYRQKEIIIVDNNSSDETLEIAKKYTKRVYTQGPERSAQRNYGAKMAKGNYLLILDSDMVLSEKILEECTAKVTRGRTEIGGLIIPEKSFGIGFWAKAKAFEREINEGEEYFEAARFFSKDLFWRVGGYDEKLTGPEDWDFPQRIAKVARIDRVQSYIYHNEGKPTLIDLARRKFYYGLSAHKYLKKQHIPVISPVTVYFIRPGFYKNLPKLIIHPFLSVGMVIMLIAESVGGGMGFIWGWLHRR